MTIYSANLKFKKRLLYVTLTELKTESNLLHFTRNCGIKNLDDFEGDEANKYLWGAGILNVKDKEMTICYIMNRCFVIFLIGGKVNVVEY